MNFPTSLDQRDGYLTDIRKVLAGNAVALPSSDQLFALMGQLRDVDALVLGGGTLDNDHGPQLFERLATALVAAQLDVPVIMGAHSLGPSLLLTDRALLRELLTLCALVGVRDDDSLHLAAELCPDHQGIVRVPDDALSLDVDWDQPKESRIAVSVDGAPDPIPRPTSWPCWHRSLTSSPSAPVPASSSFRMQPIQTGRVPMCASTS